MNGVAKTFILAVAMSALPLAAQAADKGDKASKDWPTFKKVDADNSGAISMDEARTVTGLSENFAPYDKNGDGQLSKSEYESAKKSQKSGKSSSGASSSRSDAGAPAAGSTSSGASDPAATGAPGAGGSSPGAGAGAGTR